MDNKKKWKKEGIFKYKFLKNKRYKGKWYYIYLFKTKSKRYKNTGGFIISTFKNNIISVNNDVFKEITKEELNSIIKHEILHIILKHKVDGTKSKYIKIHKELYNKMNKKDLINQLTLDLRMILKSLKV